MKITILTLFPNMLKGFFEESIVKRAQEKGLVKIKIINLRDFAKDKYKTVDDRPYGGGAGMVMKVDVIKTALDVILNVSEGSRRSRNDRIVLTSAKGTVFSQKKALEYSKIEDLIIIAGHYEGVDERILDCIDEEVSLGDFVMTGGEIATAAVVDSVVRLIPEVLKKEEATKNESFFAATIIRIIEAMGEHPVLKKLQSRGVGEVRLLEYPHYTRPEEFQGKKVPEILLSGNHKDIENWRIKKAFEETLRRRPDLLAK